MPGLRDLPDTMFGGDFAVQTGDLAASAVTTAKLNDAAVTTAKLNDDAVTSAKLDPTTIQYAEVAVSSGEILALRATPKTLVAAPGAGLINQFISAVLLLDATATAYTESDDNLAVKYTDGSGAEVSETIEATGFIDQTADTMTTARAKADAIVAKTGCENKALVLHNTGSGEYATGTGVMRVKVAYRVVASGW
jgi:hypothetical protein